MTTLLQAEPVVGTSLRMIIGQNQSPRDYLAHLLSAPGMEECCWEHLMGMVPTVPRKMEVRGAAVPVGALLPVEGMPFRNACDLLKRRNIVHCDPIVLLATTVVDAFSGQPFERCLTLMVDPITCTCGNSLLLALRNCTRIPRPTVCVSKKHEGLRTVAHLFGAFPNQTF